MKTLKEIQADMAALSQKTFDDGVKPTFVQQEVARLAGDLHENIIVQVQRDDRTIRKEIKAEAQAEIYRDIIDTLTDKLASK